MIEVRSFRDLVRLFFLFRKEFRLAVLTTIVVAIAGAFFLPAKYESTAKLLVKPGRENITLPLEVSNRRELIAPSTVRDPVVDEEKMLSGRNIAVQVAQRYLDYPFPPSDTFWGKPGQKLNELFSKLKNSLRTILQTLGLTEKQTEVDRLATKLLNKIEVSHDSGSMVIDVRLVWHDPNEAKLIVNTWIDIYLKQRTENLGRKSLYDFYEAQSQLVAQQISELKSRLKILLENLGSYSPEEKLKTLTATINKVTDEHFTLTNERTAIQKTITSIQQRIQKMPAEVVTDREISLNPIQQDLKLKLNGLYEERLRILRIYKETSPPVQDINKSIASLETEIKAHVSQLQRSENRAPNPIAVKLRQDLTDAELQSMKLQYQEDDMAAYLKVLKAQLQEALANEPEISRMLRELSAAEQSYALYIDNMEKSRIDQALDNSLISNIAVIEPPTFTPARIFPKSLQILILTLPVSLMVGILVIYLCYLVDQRIHDGTGIQKRFGIPVWSTIMETQISYSANNTFQASIYRILTQLPLKKVAEEGMTIALTSGRHGEGVKFVSRMMSSQLQKHGYRVRITYRKAEPNEIVIIPASALAINKNALMHLMRADIILLVIGARKSTIATVESTLSILKTTFKKVDGAIINRRQFEISDRVMRWLNKFRGIY